MTTTIQIGSDNDDNNELQKQQRRHLINNRRSAFIPEEDDGKKFISKDESELLRDSIIRVNRPRISRPWFDQPSTTQSGVIKDSTRSNSSSGCSSNPQSSGPSSPVSSKCSSENGNAEQQRKKTTMGEQQNGNGSVESRRCALKFEESPPQMLSASLVQKVAANAVNNNSNSSLTIRSMTAANNLPPTSPTNAAIPSNQLASANLPLLKRKEFPSHQRQRVPMPPPQKNLLLLPKHQNAVPKNNQFMGGGRRAAVDPAEEVEELSRAARKQMAILEELEVEDRERKTRIVGNRASGEGIPIDATFGDSPNSSRESTTTRLSSTSSSSASAMATACPLVLGNRILRPSCSPSTSSASSSMTGNEWSPTAIRSNRQSVGEQKHREGGLPQLLVEDITRRRQLAKNEEGEMKNGGFGGQQQIPMEMNKNGHGSGNPRKLLECMGCGGMIEDVILQALGHSFHPACFRCSKCGKCLDGIPFAVEQGGTVICMEDYERHFVPHCHACQQPINAVNEFGQVVRVVIKDREFHIQCYQCEGCGMQLSNEEPSRCFPLQDHLLCRRCNTLWRRMGALDSEAAISDL